MVKNIGVVGRWQSRRRTRVCGHRHGSNLDSHQGRLGDKTLLDLKVCFVWPGTTTSWNDISCAVVHLPQSKVLILHGTCVAITDVPWDVRINPRLNNRAGEGWEHHMPYPQWIFCTSEMGRLDRGITALCGRSGEDEKSGWSHDLRRWDKPVLCKQKSFVTSLTLFQRTQRMYPS